MAEEKTFQERFDPLQREAEGTGSAPLSTRVSSLRSEAQRYEDQRQEVSRGLLSVEETVRRCTTTLKEGGREVYLNWLSLQMAEVQRGSPPFWEPSMRRTHFNEINGWKAVFAFITEDDLREAAKLLKEQGLGEKERRGKVAELEKKIWEIEADIKRRIKEYKEGLSKILA